MNADERGLKRNSKSLWSDDLGARCAARKEASDNPVGETRTQLGRSSFPCPARRRSRFLHPAPLTSDTARPSRRLPGCPTSCPSAREGTACRRLAGSLRLLHRASAGLSLAKEAPDNTKPLLSTPVAKRIRVPSTKLRRAAPDAGARFKARSEIRGGVSTLAPAWTERSSFHLRLSALIRG
jgi:hypothetical protein